MQGNLHRKVCFRSSPNIAWVKYWGKYNEEHILPINDSLGMTLNNCDLHTTTSIQFTDAIQQDQLVLNDQPFAITKRVRRMLDLIKGKAYERKFKEVNAETWEKYKFQIKSKNSFPTASGMASSASGLACLSVALDALFDHILTQSELSQLARLGSGSACRSIYGGLVLWKGVSKQQLLQPPTPQSLKKLSQECISKTLIQESQLKYLKVIIILANRKQKEVSSTSGMQQSVQTSQLIKYRNQLAEKRVSTILSCIEEIKGCRKENNIEGEKENYNKIVECIIKDSNQFHAICLDTYPPIFYLNEFSQQIIKLVDQEINSKEEFKVAYTFDAGPHAFLIMHERNYQSIARLLIGKLALSPQQLNQKAKLFYQAESNIQPLPDVIKPYELWATDIGTGTIMI